MHHLFKIKGGGYRRSSSYSARLTLWLSVLLLIASIAFFEFGSGNSSVRVASAQTDAGICDRTLDVQLAIVDWSPDHDLNTDGIDVVCQNVTDAHLAALTTLRRVEKPSFTSLKSGDFAGMTGLTTLDIQTNEISELPADIFDGLDALTDLRFGYNNIEDLPAGVFSGLPALEILVGTGNRLTHFKADWFDGFQGFQSGATGSRLEFIGNDITTIDEDALDGMTGLARFYFSYNKIQSLPAGLFNGLSEVIFVSLHFNDLETLPEGLFDRMTADSSVGNNATLRRVNVNDNNLRSLPSGIFDNLGGLQQARLHNNSLTSLPDGLFDNNAALYEVWLAHNQLTALPSGLFTNNPSLFYLHINDNRISSLDGVGLDNKAALLNFHLNNNALTQLPDAFVTNFIDDTSESSPNNCMLRLVLDNNPFSRTWIQSGKLSDVLTAFGRRTGGCEALGTNASLKYAYRLGVGGINLDVDVTGEDKTAWQLLLDDFAASDRYHVIFHMSFGWDGQEIDSDLINALPVSLGELKIQDARFDSSVSGASFARFADANGANVLQYFFRRPDDPVLSIDQVFYDSSGNLIVGLTGLQVLRLDNVGLSGNGARIMAGLPASTMRLLEITNNPEFNDIPPGVKSLPNLIGLDLKSNGLTSLDASDLQGLNNLLFLSLEDNNIKTVHGDSLKGLTALRTLLMDDNDIADLPSGLLADLTNLRDLHITNNKLLSLPSGLFSGIANLKSIGLSSNPGAPFRIGVSVVDDTTDATMKQLHIREGAPYRTTNAALYGFTAKVVNEDGTLSSAVPVNAGATMTSQAFTIPEGGRVELPTYLPYRPGSDVEFCLGYRYCFAGFEFVLNPQPMIVGIRFDNPSQRWFTTGDRLRFKAQFDREVVVEGLPQISFMLGDEMRQATYVETTPSGELCFEYTLQATDGAPGQISVGTSTLQFPSGSSIKDLTTDELVVTVPKRTDATVVYTLTTFGTHQGLISRIEPTIRSVTVSSGDSIRIGVDVYGAQDIKDNDLAHGIEFMWSDDGSGDFDGTGREIIYTAPSQPGTYMISVSIPFSACSAPITDEIRCEATLEIRVRRASAPQPSDPAPVNPPGEIPSILVDSDGNQYEVFTPVEGGTFSGEVYSLHVPSGAVPNGEFIGIRMSDDGTASNAGMTHQRYTLGGNVYGIHAVDGSGDAISSYVLDDPARVCVPLPDALRQNISDLAVVVINGDGTLTILSAQVQISNAGTMVCGNLSSLPASVAVGSVGAPSAIPTATPEPTPIPPETGGASPASEGLIWMLLLGMGLVALASGGYAAIRARR